MLTRSRIIDRVWAPALLVLAVYGIWLCVAFQSGRDSRTFVRMGLRYLEKSHASAVIKVDRRFQYYPPNVGGYDGQYYYYIALDPAKARYYMDRPTYRYTRILYPITARLLALGQPELVPYSLILINWLAIAGGGCVAETEKSLAVVRACLRTFSGTLYLVTARFGRATGIRSDRFRRVPVGL